MLTSVFPRWTGDATPPFVRNQAEALVVAGWRVTVLAPHSKGARFRETVNGVRVIRFPYAFPWGVQKLCYEGGMLINLRTRPWTRFLLYHFLTAQIIATGWLLLRLRPQMLHTHSLLPQGFTGALLSGVAGIPHVTTSHGNDVFGLRPDGLMGRLKRWVLQTADAVTVNSSATESAVRALGCAPEKIHRIPAAPNARPPHPETVTRIQEDIIGTRSPVLLFVGRVIQDKGVGDLIDAVALLKNAFPGLLCLIVGDGQDRPAFEAQAAKHGVTGHLHWAGWVDPTEVSSWMRAADIMVVPSRESESGWKEAQGLVVVEAMLTSRPVVATRTGGIPDMIEHEVTGLLVPPGDAKALSEALKSLVTDPAECERLARNACTRADERFSPEAVTRATATLYQSIADRKSRA